MLLWKRYLYFGWLILFLFQSLLSWMLLWKATQQQLLTEDVWGFNPCYLGCCSERTRKSSFPLWRFSFNPCYLGCCSESQPMALSWQVMHEVSILVILDVALKVSCSGRTPVILFCFNPCYLGCCSESQMEPGKELEQMSFNPCYLGCCSERPNKLKGE